MEEEYGDGDEYDLAAVIQEEERGDTLCEAPGATLRRNLTMMQGGEPSPVGKLVTWIFGIKSFFNMCYSCCSVRS